MRISPLSLIALLVFFLPRLSWSAPIYVCRAEANLERGFKDRLTVAISRPEPGGTFTIRSAGAIALQGSVSEVSSLEKSDPAHRAEFDWTQGLVNEEDVSSISPSEHEKVSRIVALKLDAGRGEITVYQIFRGQRQIGGTLIIDGKGTACLPGR